MLCRRCKQLKAEVKAGEEELKIEMTTALGKIEDNQEQLKADITTEMEDDGKENN